VTKDKFIAYYRVSTDRQGQSGLGLEAQRRAVAEFLDGGSGTLLETFTEVESGKRSDRPELQAALAACRKKKATLVIAKLDRLARNVAFVSNLMESGVDFVAVDFPTANRLTIHILAAVAEHEREMIAKRTKDALAAAKARGRKLGWANPDRRDQGLASATGAKANRAGANRFAANVLPIVREIENAGITTLAGLATALNARGIGTARGGRWYPTTVRNLRRRAGGEIYSRAGVMVRWTEEIMNDGIG
jgi:DNA invertase Pin-like site-specific DNA recombinase